MKRIATASAFLPVFLAVLGWGPPWAFGIMVALAAVLGALEVSHLARQSGFVIDRTVAAAVAATACFLFLDPVTAGARILVLLVATLALSLAGGLARAGQPQGGLAAAATTLFAACYPGLLLAFLVGLRASGADPTGRRLVLLVVAVAWIADTAAYYAGSAFGRHPLSPRISPKKTVEGGIAGLLAAALTAMACRHLFLPQLGAPAALVGLGLGAIGVVGDLGESALKRGAGVKDTGSLLPGHGGILDRVDSLVLAAPAFYYYYHLTMS